MASTLAFMLLCPVLLAAAVLDYRTGRIPNRLTLSAAVLGLLLHAGVGLAQGGMAGMVEGATASVLGFLAAFIPFAVIFFAGGIGGGDVKLMAAAGAIGASWPFVLSTTVYALLIAAGWSIVLMVRHRLVKRTLSRILGAALTAAARVKPNLPNDSPRVPFAVGVAVGGVLAGLEHLLHLKMPWSAWT
jgi:Flp pilus assembly protein protease CpaA